MSTKAIVERINNVDWGQFAGPELYDPTRLAEALMALVHLEDSDQADEVGRKVITSIGNDHAGTYYPAIIEALDIIVFLAKNSGGNPTRRVSSEAILNNLYYFEPELGSYAGCKSDQLKRFAIRKLGPYKDR